MLIFIYHEGQTGRAFSFFTVEGRIDGALTSFSSPASEAHPIYDCSKQVCQKIEALRSLVNLTTDEIVGDGDSCTSELS